MTDEPITPLEIDQHNVASAVHGLMSAASTLSSLSNHQRLAPLVRNEYEDIELAHAHVGRLLERIRGA